MSLEWDLSGTEIMTAWLDQYGFEESVAGAVAASITTPAAMLVFNAARTVAYFQGADCEYYDLKQTEWTPVPQSYFDPGW
jgi:hypothetical protein